MAIHKIAGIILKDRKFLGVKEEGLDLLITPGGRVEKGETAKQTLERELREELGVRLVSMKPFGIFNDKTHDGKEDLKLETYFAEIEGEPKPNSEIEKIFWANSAFRNPGAELSIPMKKYIIPKLLEMKLID